jgi:hypothetical protein
VDAPDAQGQSNEVVRAWSALPDELKPYARLEIAAPQGTPAERHSRLLEVLTQLERARVPVVVRVAEGDPARVHPPALLEQIVAEFKTVKGVVIRGLQFNKYGSFIGNEDLAVPAEVRWASEIIPAVAARKKQVILALGGLNWPRIMANANARALFDTIAANKAYVIPVAEHRGYHTQAQTGALLGMWIEGAASHWGIGATSDWYGDAAFVSPGIYGRSAQAAVMPPSLYRAMILNGAITGATVYSFTNAADLWTGDHRAAWDTAIYPTLTELIEDSLIGQRRFVLRKTRVAYQLAVANTPQEFHLNLRDIDPILGEGFMIHGAYGVERRGQVPELMPNTGAHYWVPILSPYASREIVEGFSQVVRPAAMASAQAWRTMLDGFYSPDGTGAAFVSRMGRNVFVMHTRENAYEEQAYRIAQLPAPIRGLRGERTEEGVAVTWPFREGDIAYTVWRVGGPGAGWEAIATNVEGRRYVDAEAAAGSVTYSVTALTSETEPYEGSVNYGDFLVLSAVESRRIEAVTVSPLGGVSAGTAIRPDPDERPQAQAWWPSLDNVDPAHLSEAEAIAARIVALDDAFSSENLDGVMGIYEQGYTDPQGWGSEYVRRAYQWFFERNNYCRMDRQVRRWDFSQFASAGRVNVLLYCRFHGTALTDASGRYADVASQFPRSRGGEVWLTFSKAEGAWRIAATNPALPNFADVLSPSASPYDPMAPGPDTYRN